MPSDVLALIILLVVVLLIGVVLAAFCAMVIATIAFFLFRRQPVNDLDVSFREQLALCKVNHAPHRKNLYMLDVPFMGQLQKEMGRYQEELCLLRKEVTECQKEKKTPQAV